MFTSSPLVVTINFALFALTSAVPLTARQASTELIPGIERHDLCPPGWQYRAAGACASRFTGCARPEDTNTCSGVGFPDLLKQCARPEYGTYRECPSNGFYGCSVEDICNIPAAAFQATPTIPGVVRADLCPQGSIFRSPGDCRTGYVGCIPAGDDSICTFQSKKPIFLGTCYRTQYGKYRTCDNGFFGCHPDENVCNAPKLNPGPNPSTPTSSPVPTVTPPNSNKNGMSKFCPAGTLYYSPKTCSSGFVGCGSDAQCSGSARFYWGDCPAGTGTFYICASTGFRGCTTVQSPSPCN
jgi:hypothetical protein